MEQRTCAVCGAVFVRPRRRSHAQWAKMRFCSGQCANTWRARQQRPAVTTQQRWARSWERERTAADTAELARIVRHQRKRRKAHKPSALPRRFTAGYCKGCGGGWIDYTARQPSGYCNRCQDRRWAADSRHKRRAWKQSAKVVEVVSPDVVFRRDRYCCQLCGVKTKGTVPDLTAPTVDHIVPLALGGDHSYLNVQCACFACNSRKGARGANDQLRLVA